MFTGIVEGTGLVKEIRHQEGNLLIRMDCSFLKELKIDQSLSHNGVCLTVCALGDDYYEVTAIAETLKKTNLGNLSSGSLVNLERCMAAGGRFDGHIVQGHVDTTGVCRKIEEENGSWRIWFQYDTAWDELLVEKGSVCVSGVSLTVVDVLEGCFSVAIIPYTWEHTSFHLLSEGEEVNLEFDILGKYMKKMLEKRFQR
jgi:riboflavin synthase